MAILRGGLFGQVSGKIGDFTIRNVNGKTIVASRPKNFKKSNSPKSIEGRQKFTVNSSFTKAVTGFPVLYQIWELNKKKATTPRSAIFMANYNLSSAQAPTINNIITPYSSFKPVEDITIAGKEVKGSLAKMDELITLNVNEKVLSINILLCLFGSKNENNPYYDFIALSKEIEGFDFSKQYDFEIGLDQENSDLIEKYDQKIIYAAIASKTTTGKIIHYSSTYSKLS